MLGIGNDFPDIAVLIASLIKMLLLRSGSCGDDTVYLSRETNTMPAFFRTNDLLQRAYLSATAQELYH